MTQTTLRSSVNLVFLTLTFAALAAFPRLSFAAEAGDCTNYLKSDNPLGYELSVACTVTKKYGDIIEPIAHMHEYDERLITAVIVVESRGKPEATSHVGAKGLMQLMPKTAKYVGAKDIRDPFENILAGTKYLRMLEEDYGFLSVEEALLAYNMGPRKAAEWLDEPGRSASDATYVRKVMRIYSELKAEEEKAQQKRADANAQDLLQKLLLKITAQADEVDLPEVSSPRRISIETKRDGES